MIKNLFDFLFAIALIMILFIPMILIAMSVKLSSKGNVIFWSDRVGQNNKIFKMPKFRTMIFNTPDVATHLLNNPDSYYTPLGRLLRQSSLDELPQLWSILIGHMSFVGPRPALHNQDDLISLRTKYDIHKLKPGLTGLAQINGRDEISILEKVEFDLEYLRKHSFFIDLEVLFLVVGIRF